MLDAITDKYIIRFRNRYIKERDEGLARPESPLAELKSSAKLSNDMDMQTKISIVEKYKGNLPNLIAQLKKVDVGTRPQDLKRANFVLSTAHRAKGLEFDHVMLWKDFMEVNCCTPVQRDPATGYATLFRCGDEYSADIIGADELNIVYVAATRAMKRLIVNVSLEALLNLPPQTWYLRAVPGQQGPNRELLAKRRAGLPRFATLRCPTIGTGGTNASLPYCRHCSHDSRDTAIEDRTPALGMEVRYGRTRSSDHVRDDPDRATPIGSNPLLPRDDGEWDGRLCGRCVRTYACSRRGAREVFGRRERRGWTRSELGWTRGTRNSIYKRRARGVDGGIGPIEGMSMMDIASVCAAERRARGEPWRGKDAAGLAVRIPE
jgi:F-box protein 18 (helicase)